MKKVEAILSPSQVEAVRDALIQQRSLDGFTVTDVWGIGPQLRRAGTYRGSSYEVDTPRVKVEVVVQDEYALPCVYAIVEAARAGSPPDACVLVVPVSDAVRIRTGEHGVAALDGRAHAPSRDWPHRQVA